MTKCAGCRVRHLNCDTQSICIECKKSDRECVRLNVRFRHLVCPSQSITRTDYGKYEFFFDREQTWVDTKGRLEFVCGSDGSADPWPTNKLEPILCDAVGLSAESRPALVELLPSTFVLESTSHTLPVQASIRDDDQSDYLEALEKLPHDPPSSVTYENTSEIPAALSKEQPGEKLPSDTSVSYSEMGLSTPEPAWSLNSLQEGKLLQHFVTHLAPWVCANVFLMS